MKVISSLRPYGMTREGQRSSATALYYSRLPLFQENVKRNAKRTSSISGVYCTWLLQASIATVPCRATLISKADDILMYMYQSATKRQLINLKWKMMLPICKSPPIHVPWSTTKNSVPTVNNEEREPFRSHLSNQINFQTVAEHKSRQWYKSTHQY